MDVVDMLIRGATAVLPVLTFLWGLVMIDSYKLVRLGHVLFSVLAGVLMAAVAYPLQSWLIARFGWAFDDFSRYGAPLIEEILKAGFIILLIRSHRIGFQVDGAIHGFAVGAGFSVVENLYYVVAIPSMGFVDLVVRGFGTAIMHGGATAIFAVMARTFAERSIWLGIAVAWLCATVIHAVYNQLVLPPMLMTLLLAAVLPLVFLVVFTRSEEATRSWLGAGFDIDQELLGLLMVDDLRSSRVGEYLHTLRTHFPGEIVADMLCYLRLHAELSIQAKGMLMMREAGFDPKPSADARAKLEEMEYLKGSIGRTGLLALSPFLHRSSRDLWQMNVLR